MSKEVIRVTAVIRTKSQKGTFYTRVNDRFNLFEDTDVKFFEDNLGKNVEINLEKSNCGKYENLRGDYKVTTEEISTVISAQPGKTSIPQAPQVAQATPVVALSHRTYGLFADKVTIAYDGVNDLMKKIDDLVSRSLMPSEYFKSKADAEKAERESKGLVALDDIKLPQSEPVVQQGL